MTVWLGGRQLRISESALLTIRCPWCSTVQSKDDAVPGQLGRLTHLRCRLRGGQFSKGAH